jgi:phage nucleotide-binding protein
MAVKFTDTREASQLQGVKVLVYGCEGVGKTRLCATAPNPIIISCEGGLLSLKKEKKPVIEIENFDDLETVYNYFITKASFKKFKTICLDSISDIAEKVLSEEKKGKKDKRQAYGETQEMMSDMIRKFRDLKGFNVYFSAKEDIIRDSEGHVVQYRPSMPGNTLKNDLPYYFDEVFRLTIGPGKQRKKIHYLQTKNDYYTRAKDRSGTLSEKEKPNLTGIFNKIANG